MWHRRGQRRSARSSLTWRYPYPVEHVVGYDALAVFIHLNNPATARTLAELKDIYGRKSKAKKWSDIGLTVRGFKSDQIVVVSRQNNSGTYAYFKNAVLGKKGKYRQGTLDMHGSKDVVDLAEKTPCAIGYSGLAYATDHIKTARVAKDRGAGCVNPSVESAVDGSYPIARPLVDRIVRMRQVDLPAQRKPHQRAARICAHRRYHRGPWP